MRKALMNKGGLSVRRQRFGGIDPHRPAPPLPPHPTTTSLLLPSSLPSVMGLLFDQTQKAASRLLLHRRCAKVVHEVRGVVMHIDACRAFALCACSCVLRRADWIWGQGEPSGYVE